MAEPELHPFNRFYKYKTKTQETPFFTRYILTPEAKLVGSVNKKKETNQKYTIIDKKEIPSEEKPEKIQISDQAAKNSQVSDKKQEKKQTIENKVQLLSSDRQEKEQKLDAENNEEQKSDKKIKMNFRDERKKIEMTLEQRDELREYTKVNLKNVKIIDRKDKQQNKQQQEQANQRQKKKKKYTKVQQKNYKSKQDNKDNQKYDFKKSKDEKKNERSTSRKRIFPDYISLQEIQKSIEQGQNKYFKGRVQFGQGPKHRGKIISEEVEGILLIQGNHCNRSLHDDKVYFEIIHQENQKTFCKIVHKIQQAKEVVGRLQFIYSKNIYALHPINSRIASMNVASDSNLKGIKQNINTHYFKAEYIGWEVYSEYPSCKLIDIFGQFGQIQVQTGALLKTHGIPDIEYDNQMVKKDLNKFLSKISERGQYIIPEEQISKRQDLRKQRIFTIDPENARDFDDALSITKKKDHFQVGVHIADASFFCEQGSLVDEQAKKRTTSVYLVHRVIPMLPRILCENLCSLNPGCERLTFTLWIKVDENGSIIGEPKITRSVIKSCARFTYEQAQGIIQGFIKNQQEIQEGFGCVKSEQFGNVADDLLSMHNLAAKLRQKRVDRGSLFFQIPKKVFQLDETKKPKDFKIYQRKQAHYLVEQFMILANEVVGDILRKQLKEEALLRRHRYPGPKKVERFEQFMKKAGVSLTLTSNTRVQNQINEVIQNKTLKQSIKDIVRYETVGLLEQADYFLIGKSAPQTWVHYALNAPVYTHFTSPIRRYPDIIVHRQLASIIQKQIIKNKITKELIELCNQKKLMAKRVSNGCQKIFMCLYLKQNKVVTRGIISEVDSWGIKICVPSFDFRGTLRIRDVKGLDILAAEQDYQGRKILKMKYKGEVVTNFILKQYQQIQVRLSTNQGFPLDYQISIIMPHPQHQGKHIIIG